jgi:hypothetical protein
MRNRLIFLVCLTLLSTFCFAQQKTPPSGRAIQADQPSQCDDPMAFPGNLVMNCGFETGNFNNWTLTGPIDFVGVDADHAQSGNFGAFFGAIGGFTQLTSIVPTMQGRNYHIEFQLANPEGGTGTFFRAFLGNTPLMTLEDSDPDPYRLFVFNVDVSVTDAQLLFLFRQDPDFWWFDDVYVKLNP